jgi:hypothetical protein
MYASCVVHLPLYCVCLFRHRTSRLNSLYVTDRNMYFFFVGRDSSVGVATRYGLDGLGIESRRGRDFPHPSRPPPGTHPASYTMGTGSFSGVKRPGCGVDHNPQLAARLKERAELCRAFMAFSRVNIIFYLTDQIHISFPRLTFFCLHRLIPDPI